MSDEKKHTLKKRLEPPGRRNTGSGDWSAAFLAHLRQTANVRGSCAAAGVTRRTVYDRRATDEAFADAWSDALADAIDDLEQVAFDRAKSTSDTLVIFLLKSHRRAVYGDKVEVSGLNRLMIKEEVVNGDGHSDDQAPPQAG